MANKIKFANNASVRITKALTTDAKTIEVAAGDADFFPVLNSTDEYFILTLLDDVGNFEIVKCTSRTSNSFAVQRAQEGTTAKAFKKGSVVENRLTAGSITQIFQQALATQSKHGIVRLATKAEVDSGVTSGNAPAVITPEVLTPTLQKIQQDAFIAGGIVAFSGKFQGNYPIPKGATAADTNWHLCNGANGTPDLRNRFIMGCDVATAIGTVGGKNFMSGVTGPVTLTLAQMPSHGHAIGPTYPEYGGSWFSKASPEPWEGVGAGQTVSLAQGSSEPHFHSLGTNIDNRPAYYTLAYIMKIK